MQRSLDILIVEDDALVALDFAAIVQAAGHRVLGPVGALREAVLRCERTDPDAALIDIDLGGRPDGIRLAAILHGRGVPCLFVTAHPHVARDHQHSAYGFLSKPVAPGALVAAVEAVWRLSQGQSPERVPRALQLFSQQPAFAPFHAGRRRSGDDESRGPSPVKG